MAEHHGNPCFVQQTCSLLLQSAPQEQAALAEFMEKKSFGCCVARPFAHSECLRAMGDAPAAMRDSSRCRTEEKRQGKCEREMRKTDRQRKECDIPVTLSFFSIFPYFCLCDSSFSCRLGFGGPDVCLICMPGETGSEVTASICQSCTDVQRRDVSEPRQKHHQSLLTNMF